MRPDDRIDAWARERATAEAAPDFADRVMIAAAAGRRNRVISVVVIVAATVAGAARIAAAFALFIPR